MISRPVWSRRKQAWPTQTTESSNLLMLSGRNLREFVIRRPHHLDIIAQGRSPVKKGESSLFDTEAVMFLIRSATFQSVPPVLRLWSAVRELLTEIDCA
jgi:hypothetical protein